MLIITYHAESCLYRNTYVSTWLHVDIVDLYLAQLQLISCFERTGIFKGKTVLVDMDNTLVDWDAEFIHRFAHATGRPITEVDEMVRKRAKFEIEENN